MLSRPGRIRYVKTYGNLPLDTIMEIIDDKLTRKKYKDSLIKFISKLDVITVDIVSSLVNEVNIFDEDPSVFAPFFNVKTSIPKNDVYKLVQSKNGDWEETIVKYNAKIVPAEVNTEALENHDNLFYVNGRYIGEIIEIKEGGAFIVKEIVEKPDGTEESRHTTYRAEKVVMAHFEYTPVTTL